MSRLVIALARLCGRAVGYWRYGYDRGRLEGWAAANAALTRTRGSR